MTERRPHWSDDLIDAVRDAVDVEFDDIWKLSDDSILAVIAAVEDNRPPSLSDLQVQHYAELREQAERAGQGLDVEALISARMEQVARAEKAEAAVRRVRELHTSEAPDGYEYEFDITVRGGHWVQCDCCDSAHCCDKAVRTCLACGDDMPCPTLRVLNGDSDE